MRWFVSSILALSLGLPGAASASGVDSVAQRDDGAHFFGVGLFGMAVPGADQVLGAGLVGRWSFETPAFGVLSDVRVGDGRRGSGSISFASIGLGGRWFILDRSWSPFLGFGLAFTQLDVREREGFDGSLTGLGGWLEVGAQIFRHRGSRLSLDLRAEPVFGELRSGGGEERASYLPLTYGLTYLF